MASVGMRCPGHVRLLVQGSQTTFHRDRRRGAVSLISSRRRRSMLSKDKNITMLAMSSSSSTEEKMKKNYYRTLQKAVPSKYKSIKDDKKADEWMKESVVEIVRNLREAPLLLHLYTSRPEQTTLESGVEDEDWVVQLENWGKGAAPLPDGVIFVEQLQGQDDDEEGEEDRAWGIVVQGRGLDCGPVCYLLKTSSGCAGGLGLCCTHFCLMRVHNFWDTARSQLTNCWLLPQAPPPAPQHH